MRHAHLRAARFVGWGERVQHGAALAEQAEHRRQILHAFGDDVDDAGFVLQLAADGDKTGADDNGAQALERLGPDNDIGDADLVFEGHEDDAFGGARTLAHQHEAGDGDARAAFHLIKRVAAFGAAGVEALAHKGDRMGLQRKGKPPIIFDHMRAQRHGRQMRIGLSLALGTAGGE